MSVRLEWAQGGVWVECHKQGERLGDGNRVTEPLALVLGTQVIEGTARQLGEVLARAEATLAEAAEQAPPRARQREWYTLDVFVLGEPNEQGERWPTGSDSPSHIEYERVVHAEWPEAVAAARALLAEDGSVPWVGVLVHDRPNPEDDEALYAAGGDPCSWAGGWVTREGVGHGDYENEVALWGSPEPHTDGPCGLVAAAESRTVLVHLSVEVPAGDGRSANEVADALMGAVEVGRDNEATEGLGVVVAMAEVIA